jgi:hypothetical protein
MGGNHLIATRPTKQTALESGLFRDPQPEGKRLEITFKQNYKPSAFSCSLNRGKTELFFFFFNFSLWRALVSVFYLFVLLFKFFIILLLSWEYIVIFTKVLTI